MVGFRGVVKLPSFEERTPSRDGLDFFVPLGQGGRRAFFAAGGFELRSQPPVVLIVKVDHRNFDAPDLLNLFNHACAAARISSW